MKRLTLGVGADMDVGIRLLGTPLVRLAGQWTPLGAGKAGAVLAFAAHRGGPVRRAEVAALLWPKAEEQRASTNLRQLLLGIREGPLAPLLARDHSSIWATAASDVLAFTSAAREGRLDEAIELYGGRFLDGRELTDETEMSSWVTSERDALENQWRRLMLSLIETSTREGHHARGLELAQRLLRADPFDEVALRHAVAAAAASGDGYGARRLFESFRDVLRSELGLAPDAATLVLMEDLSRTPGRGADEDSSRPRPRSPARPAAAAKLAPQMRYRRRLIGRVAELGEVLRLLSLDSTRLLTMLAPGGTGKTALAAAVADELTHDFDQGVVVVPLDRVTGDDAVVNAVAAACGLSLVEHLPSRSQVTAALATSHALIVLDGFEPHVAQADFVSDLLRDCPDLKIVATSRVSLKLTSEILFALGPVDTATTAPDGSVEDPTSPLSEAAQLFIQAARGAVGAPFGPPDLATIERICIAVGGNPLAIELLAGWLDLMSLDQIEQAVAADWDLLRADDVDRPARRGDLQAAIEETYLQLAPEDRRAWERLAVMPGSLDRAVAAEVSGTGWRGLRRLAERAVVRSRGERIELHALLARYGRERAAVSGSEAGAWSAALAAFRQRIALEVDPRSGVLVRMHQHDLDQAFAAWRWAVANSLWEPVADMCYGLQRALARVARGVEFSNEAAAASRKVRGEPGSRSQRALARLLPFAGSDTGAHLTHSYSALVAREPLRDLEVLATAQMAAEMAEALGDQRALGVALSIMLSFDQAGDARGRFTRARAAFEAAGDAVGLARLLYDRGHELVILGHVEEGDRYLHESVELNARLGDHTGQAHAHDMLTVAPMLRGDVAGSFHHLRLAQAHFEAAGIANAGNMTLASEAWLAKLQGDRELAEALLTRTLEAERQRGDIRLFEALERLHLHATFREFDRVKTYALQMLELSGAPLHPSFTNVAAHQQLARALVVEGDVDGAITHLEHAVRMTAALDAPRYVPRVALTVGELLVALGQAEQAWELLEQTWFHPALEFQYRRDLRICLTQAGLDEPVHPRGTRLSDDQLLHLAYRLAVNAVGRDPADAHLRGRTWPSGASRPVD